MYLVTAVTDWEGRVYPTAVGIALLTCDSQPHSARASRNVCKQYHKKELGRVVYDPGIDLLLFQLCKWLVDDSNAPLLGVVSWMRELVGGNSVHLCAAEREV